MPGNFDSAQFGISLCPEDILNFGDRARCAASMRGSSLVSRNEAQLEILHRSIVRVEAGLHHGLWRVNIQGC